MTDSNPTPVDPVATAPVETTPAETKGLAEEIAGGDAGEAIAAEHQMLVDEIFAALTAYEENEDPTPISELPIAYTSAGERVVAILSTAIGLDGEETDEETDEEAPTEEAPTEEESVSRTIDSISRALTRIREKKGAVLSKPNKAALSEASKLINGVLAQAETEDDGKSVATPDILSALAELTKRLDRIAPEPTPDLDEPVEDLTAYLS